METTSPRLVPFLDRFDFARERFTDHLTGRRRSGSLDALTPVGQHDQAWRTALPHDLYQERGTQA